MSKIGTAEPFTRSASSKELALVSRVALIMASLVISLQATTVTFSDESFDTANWTAVKIEDSTPFASATFTAGQVDEGGNLSAFRRVTHTYRSGTVGVAHLHNAAVITPSDTIFSIDYSYDLIHLNPPSLVANVAYALLLFQNGTYYRLKSVDTILRATWKRFGRQSLREDEFVRVAGNGPALPDFSANAGPIQFGYMSRNSTDARSEFRESGIDNWSVTVRQSSFVTVSAASFVSEVALAPESIASGFRTSLEIALAPGSASATSVPLPTTLFGTSVEITDSLGTKRLAGLYFVSPGQINFLLPAGTALGPATIDVFSGEDIVATGQLEIADVAPSLFTANAQGKGVAAAFYLRVAPDGSRTQELIYNQSTLDPIPIDLGPPGDRVFLLLFGTGMRGGTGTAAATVGGDSVSVAGPAPHAEFLGLDQVNLGPLPRSLVGRALEVVVLEVGGKSANKVSVRFQ